MNFLKKILLALDRRKIIKLSDKLFLQLLYEKITKKKLDLNTPKTFNEKLQWLKLYDRNPEYTKMVDKYLVKDYVANIIGDEYIIPTLGVYDNFHDINFEKLPNQFVLKCTHDSGSTIVCKNKKEINFSEVKQKINRALKQNFFYQGREWPYKYVKPRIIIEKYMVDESREELKDYKFFCFNGKVRFFKVDFNRFIKHRANYYDTSLNLLPFGEEICPPDMDKKIDIPNNVNHMIDLAEILSKNTSFVRVDFYNINEKI